MQETICYSCRRPKANLSCNVCEEPICKACAQFLEVTRFSFLKAIPEELSHTHYCPNCYDAHVAPALESYNEIMERARKVYFFFTTQKRQIPVFRKSREVLKVDGCEDRNETILRLGFFAAEQGHNAIIEAEVTCKTIRNSGYQKSEWKGTGIAATVDAEKLERAASRE